MYPFPLVFCPPGVAKPACCPPGAPVAALHPAKGPDVAHLAETDRNAATAGREWGICYGGAPADDTTWQPMPGGWWIALSGFRPQDLLRVDPHPRVLRWRTVQGAQRDHWWTVPVILAEREPGTGLVSALDRLVGPDGTRVPSPDLLALQEPLLAIANGVALGLTVDERNAAVAQLAAGLLGISHWVDLPLLIAAGWLSELTLARIVIAAYDRVDDPAEQLGDPDAMSAEGA